MSLFLRRDSLDLLHNFKKIIISILRKLYPFFSEVITLFGQNELSNRNILALPNNFNLCLPTIRIRLRNGLILPSPLNLLLFLLLSFDFRVSNKFFS